MEISNTLAITTLQWLRFLIEFVHYVDIVTVSQITICYEMKY